MAGPPSPTKLPGTLGHLLGDRVPFEAIEDVLRWFELLRSHSGQDLGLNDHRPMQFSREARFGHHSPSLFHAPENVDHN